MHNVGSVPGAGGTLISTSFEAVSRMTASPIRIERHVSNLMCRSLGRAPRRVFNLRTDPLRAL
jgi:hypothetical protein